MTAASLFRSVAAPAPDADLLGRFLAARDEAAFAELVRRHGPVVYRVCRRIVGPSSADDAFQATFLILATRGGRVQKATSVGSWLIGVAGRVARQMRKRDARFSPPHPQPLSPEGRGEPATADLASILDDELTRLPDRLRGPLVACLVQHRTHKQAAAELSESERTLRRRLDEAKRLLRLRLERRGVVPAVAAGLVCGLGAASASVLRELADRAVDLVFDFLAGGAATASAPAVIAKGVTMNGLLWTAKAAMAAVAVGLTALGVGLAGDPPKVIDKPPMAEQKPVRPNAPPDLSVLTWHYEGPSDPPKAERIPAVGRREPDPKLRQLVAPHGWTATVRSSEVNTKNFVVTASDPVVARAVANEAEHQRKAQAEKWLGKELPAWKQPGVIEVHIVGVKVEPTRPVGATAFTYNRAVGFGKEGVDEIRMSLGGSFEGVLRSQLPREVTHAVLASHFGKPLPRWADEGIALTSEPTAAQLEHDIRCREVLNAGRGIRLSHLLPMMEYPQDLPVLYAQGHSLVQFLLTRRVKPVPGEQGEAVRRQGVIKFVYEGLNNGTWDEAVRAVYGFDDVDAMQEAWIDWLRKPSVATTPSAETKDDGLIPPTRLGK